jgi:HSP20 family protein
MADIHIGKHIPDLPNIRDRMEQIWRAVTQPHTGPLTREGVWHPILDIYEREDAIVVEVELPGMKGQTMNVAIDDNHLIIEGSRAQSESFKEGDLSYRERPVGEFHRIIHLSENVDADGAEAKYEDGILTVTMPRSARGKGKKIEIT